MYSLNLVFGAIENCIHSIWTLGRLKIVFTQSENLEDDWNLYSLNLEFSYNGQKIQIRILMIETLSTQLFGDVEFSFLFHHNNQFYPCEILSLSLSLFSLFWTMNHFFFFFFFFFLKNFFVYEADATNFRKDFENNYFLPILYFFFLLFFLQN